MLDKAIRDLDRERMGLQTQEKKLVAEIKKTAKQGQMVRSEILVVCGAALGELLWPFGCSEASPERLTQMCARYRTL